MMTMTMEGYRPDYRGDHQHQQQQQQQQQHQHQLQQSRKSDVSMSSNLTMRLCHMRKRAGENGYGFNLMSKRDKLCQYVGKVDAGTPAYVSGLRSGDKIIEIDNINVSRLTYREIMDLIRKGLRIANNMYRPDELLMLVVDQETDNLFRLNSVPMTSNNSSIPIEFKSSTINMSSISSISSPSKSADSYANDKSGVASVYSNPTNIPFAPTSTTSLNTITNNNKTIEIAEPSSSKPRENHGYTSSYTQTNSQPYSYAQSSTSGPAIRARNGYATSRKMGGHHHHEGEESSSVDEISININLSNENFYSNSSFNSTSASAASNDDAELVTFV